MPKQKDGCATLSRRTFLFLVGLAGTKFVNDYFFAGESRDKAIALFKKFEREVNSQLKQKAKNLPPIASSPEFNNLPSNPVVNSQFPIFKNSNSSQPAQPKTKPSIFKKGKPIQLQRQTINGVSFYLVEIDLNDPEIFMTVGLANNAPQANNAQTNYGDEAFSSMVARYRAAVVTNGTFFSKDAQKRVMGNLIAGGKFLKYSQWENYGTTLGIGADNRLEMVTARLEGQPNWQQHWFSLTCGPRLLKRGKIAVNPKAEGFSDPHVLDVGGRSALGFPARGKKLYLVSFLSVLSLEKEAQLMKAIGCAEAMNLDGGASRSFAYRGKILVPAGRPLTNTIIVYDTKNPAPQALKESWHSFQRN
jgi:Phosphodiester glycosidase